MLASASPAFADGPTEQRSLTHNYVNGNGDNVSCTLTLTLITRYQNDTKRGFAGWNITDSAACRNAFLFQSVSWFTPNGGNAADNENYFAAIPASAGEAYSPLNTNVHTSQLTESVSVSFSDCMNNCNLNLSLTADGKA